MTTKLVDIVENSAISSLGLYTIFFPPEGSVMLCYYLKSNDVTWSL